LKYDVWWDEELVPEGLYSEHITKHVTDATAVVVVWSKEATQSIWVRSEASEAVKQGKLVNACVAGFNLVEIPKPFEQIHCVLTTELAAITKALQAKKVPRGRAQVDPITRTALLSNDLLPFLKICTTSELDGLVQVIDQAWNADKLVEKKLSDHPLFPDHAEYVDEIDRQFRLLGGHALANALFRDRQGPTYAAIVSDLYRRKTKPKLASRLSSLVKKADIGVVSQFIDQIGGGSKESEQPVLPPLSDTAPVMELEKRLLILTFDDLFAKLSSEQKEELAQSINDDLSKRGTQVRFDPRIKGPATTILLQTGANLSGFFIYRASAILLNAFSKAFLQRGLTFAANASVMRTLGVATGPVGWMATGLYSVYEAQTPAYRSLEHGVLLIAAFREMKLYSGPSDPA
jgi:uncharacterized protein YaaW (UPF0174 family)